VENTALSDLAHRTDHLDLSIFGISSSSAEGWSAITALVIIVVAVLGFLLWRQKN